MQMFIYLFILIIISCKTVPTSYNIENNNIEWKYKIGSCVKFNPVKFKNTDGTVMKITGIDGLKYVVSIKHKKIKDTVFFTAIKKPFESDTLLTNCPRGLN